MPATLTISSVGVDSISGRLSTPGFDLETPLKTGWGSLRLEDSFLSGVWSITLDEGVFEVRTSRLQGKYLIVEQPAGTGADEDNKHLIAEGREVVQLADVLSTIRGLTHMEVWDSYWAERAELILDASRDWSASDWTVSPARVWVDTNTYVDDDLGLHHCEICRATVWEGEDEFGGVPMASGQEVVCSRCHESFMLPRSLDFGQLWDWNASGTYFSQ